MNRSEVAALLAVCAAAYPHVNVSKETASLYAEMLADLDPQVAMGAVRRLIATSQFFPTVAAIREQAAAMVEPLAPSPAKAWAEVMAKMREVGRSTVPEWSHPTIAAAVATLGWRDLCMSDNQAVSRAHFWKVYDAAAREHKQQAILPPSMRAIGTA